MIRMHRSQPQIPKRQCVCSPISLLIAPYQLKRTRNRAQTCCNKRLDLNFHILNTHHPNDRSMLSKRINCTYALTCLILYTNMKSEKWSMGRSKLIPRVPAAKGEEGGNNCKQHPSLDLDTICFHPACR